MTLERKKLKNDTHKRMQVLLDAMPFACHLWDKDLKIIESNDESLRLFNINDKNIFQDCFFGLLPEYQPDGQRSDEKAIACLNKALSDGRCVFKFMHQELDGTPIPTEVTLIRVVYEDEYVIAAYVRDMREYNQMQAIIDQRDKLLHAVNNVASILLSYEEETFEAALQKAMGCIADIINVDRVYIWKNEMIDGVLYYTNQYEWLKDEEYHGELVHPAMKYPYNTSPRWESLFRRGECVNSPVSCLPPEEAGMLQPYHIKSILVLPVYLYSDFWGFVSFDDCKDERVFTADEVDILRSASLMIVNAITKYLMMSAIQATAAQLKHAVTAAQDASNTKSSFLATMSHEIRTPMNAIVGMTRIGKSASDMEKMIYAFDRIDGASNHLLGVINDILDISKIESGKFELSYGEFSFEETLKTVVNVISFRTEEKHQKFSIFIDEKIPHNLIGDDQRLSQVIVNLLSNAVKFTPANQSIRLDAHLVDEKDGICTLKISIKDSGIGVSAEQQARLFSSFQQADSSISRKFGGTGLGLVISKHIIERMGGKIWVESDLGAGATFSFTIQAERGLGQTNSPLLSDFNRTNLRLLVVDDDPDTLEWFTYITRQLGLKCDTAANAAEALRYLDIHSYEIFFIDWDMPDINGIELSRQIISREGKKSIIVICSAYSWNDIERDAKAVGVTRFLPKPLLISTVADCINKCFAKAPALFQEAPSDEVLTFKGYRMLLVEDLEINREIVLAMLEPTLLVIDCAENGAEAVRMFEESHNRYDVIFMDIQMPGIDGYEATRRIRALDTEKAKTIPIIAMTANVFREDIDKCLQAGMTGHLGKPIDQDKMLNILREHLKQLE